MIGKEEVKKAALESGFNKRNMEYIENIFSDDKEKAIDAIVTILTSEWFDRLQLFYDTSRITEYLRIILKRLHLIKISDKIKI